MVKVLQTVTMASGANAWQDRQAGDFDPYWQRQQLPETQPWFPENQLSDATPEELALLQRLNAEPSMWWGEVPIAPVQEAPEWTPTWWNGVDMRQLQPEEVKNEWSQTWPWPEGAGMDMKMEFEGEWQWESQESRLPDASEKQPALEEDDRDLAEQMTAQVALFLAGGDLEDSDSDPVEPALDAATAMTIDAPPFVPGALVSSEATPGRTELRLDDILPKDGVMMPTVEGMTTFLNVLQSRQLPLELQDPTNLNKFEGAIAKAVLNSYKKRQPPTVKMLQKELRETQQLKEEWIHYLLPVCARDASKMYYIQPSMRGEQPTILLSRPPLWFQGFLENEDDIKQQVAIDSVSGDVQMSIGMPIGAPVPQEDDAKERRRRFQEGKGARRIERKARHPLVPGAVDPKEVGAVKKWESSQAESEYSTDTNQPVELNEKDEATANRVDISTLLQELMLAFPRGMRFATLKEQLLRSNDGVFSENAFKCSAVARDDWHQSNSGASIGAPPGLQKS